MKNRILIDFGEYEEGELLSENIKKLCRIHGISQKRVFLIGVAKFFENESPEIVTQIADYLSRPRRRSK